MQQTSPRLQHYEDLRLVWLCSQLRRRYRLTRWYCLWLGLLSTLEAALILWLVTR